MLADQCLSDAQILEYASGRLVPADAHAAERHLASCEHCCTLLAETAKWLDERGEEATELEGEPTLSREELSLLGETLPPMTPGTALGRYEVQGFLGRGGMSVVYAAHDPELHRNVAIKVLRADVSARRGAEESKARLLREARAMARVSDPHVVTVYDVGEWKGRVFIAMELVEGRTLRALVEERKPWRDVVAAFVMAGKGLAAAHAKGLVHRDFKPANVLLGTDGRVRVTDFGLARGVLVMRGDAAVERTPSTLGATPGSASAVHTLTESGQLVGTPAYMAPEQFTGGAVDAKSDQFSFAVALHEALYGERPFGRGSTMEIVARMHSGVMATLPNMNSVPPELRAILLRALEIDPSRRFGSMTEMLMALESATKPEKAPAHRWTVAAAGAAAMVLFAGAALSLTTRSGGAAEAREARPDPATARAIDAPTEIGMASASPSEPALPPPWVSVADGVTSTTPTARPTSASAKPPAPATRPIKRRAKPSSSRPGSRPPIGDEIEDPF